VTENSINGDRAPQTLAFLLSQVGIHASRRFAERIAAVELNPPLFRVLNLVAAAEGQSQQAIGAAIEIPASRMVDRRPKPEDRRVRALFLTAKGKRCLARGRKIAKEHEEELTKGMSATDRALLVSMLQQIVDQQALGKGVHPGLSDKDPAK
jgi:hypothetical protein